MLGGKAAFTAQSGYSWPRPTGQYRNALFTTSAAKFWTGMGKIKLELDLAEASIFSFTDTMVSNLLGS